MSMPTVDELRAMHREVLIRDRPALLEAKGDSSNVWGFHFEMVVIRERDPMPYPDHTGKDHAPGERHCLLCKANCEEFRVPPWAATSIYDRGWREGQMVLTLTTKSRPTGRHPSGPTGQDGSRSPDNQDQTG